MSHTILIIEDDAALLRGLVDNLDAQGYRVLSATDGEKGLQAALSTSPDLIVLDIMLPKRNGYEICGEIRRRKLDMPIVMLTAMGQEEDIVRGLEMGADDYVTKPFGIRELLARIKAFLRRSETAAADCRQFGDCRFDFSSKKLFRDGVETPLTTKERELLEFFLHRLGRALTRGDILNGVWGREIIVGTRSVDRCVTTLRAKIEPDPARPTLIRTIRDIGYRFEPAEGER